MDQGQTGFRENSAVRVAGPDRICFLHYIFGQNDHLKRAERVILFDGASDVKDRGPGERQFGFPSRAYAAFAGYRPVNFSKKPCARCGKDVPRINMSGQPSTTRMPCLLQ